MLKTLRGHPLLVGAGEVLIGQDLDHRRGPRDGAPPARISAIALEALVSVAEAPGVPDEIPDD